MNNKVVRGVLGAVLAFACVCAFAQDATLNRARQLIQNKQFKEAFALLEPQEQSRAGDPEFDYVFGVAAIDAGQLTRGVFALERVLAVNPNHQQARAEIARAYFLMGENKTARSEFGAVKAAQPPAEVSSVIDRFLDALDARERARHTGTTAYVEVGLGHDSNANAATATNSFAVPAFGGAILTLGANQAQSDDYFWTLAAGVNGRYGINDKLGLIGSLSFDRKMNSTLEQFDYGSVNASGGFNIRDGADDWTIALQTQRFTVENDRFRDATGGTAQFRRNLTPNDQVSAYVQYTRMRYPGQSQRDANRMVFGGALAHSFAMAGSPVLYGGGYLGREDTTGHNVPHFGHDVYGVRGGGQISLSDQWTLTGSASYEERRYHGPDPLFQTNRHDKELQLRAGLVYAKNKNWSVTPAIAYTNVDSNIVTNTYDRRLISITARYDMR